MSYLLGLAFVEALAQVLRDRKPMVIMDTSKLPSTDFTGLAHLAHFMGS